MNIVPPGGSRDMPALPLRTLCGDLVNSFSKLDFGHLKPNSNFRQKCSDKHLAPNICVQDLVVSRALINECMIVKKLLVSFKCLDFLIEFALFIAFPISYHSYLHSEQAVVEQVKAVKDGHPAPSGS